MHQLLRSFMFTISHQVPFHCNNPIIYNTKKVAANTSVTGMSCTALTSRTQCDHRGVESSAWKERKFYTPAPNLLNIADSILIFSIAFVGRLPQIQLLMVSVNKS